MKHKCALETEDPILDNLKWFQRIKLLSPTNPRRLSYFRSDVSVREEKHRHLKVNKYAIHPFSSFRAWYEVYLIYLFGTGLLTKPLDAGFMTVELVEEVPDYQTYTIFTDVLFWVNIVLNFFTGREVPMNKMVELRARYIAKRYVFGPYFIFDLASSVPRGITYYHPDPLVPWRKLLRGIITLLGMCRIVRLASFVRCINRSAEYFEFKSRGMLFLLNSTLVFFIIGHWMGCLQFYVPRIFRRSFVDVMQNTSWYIVQNLSERGFLQKYTHGMFRSSAYILGINLPFYRVNLPEEYALAIFTYFIGKILIAFIWVILAVAILNSRLMEIKYEETINQLKEYMRQRQLPQELCNRILQYFSFKYRNKYFQERLIGSLLSDNLRNEANQHVCKSLIKNVSVFSDLNPTQLRKVVDCLIPEIVLPGDTIIHAGTHGDAMYFLFSGTVAVYTRTGKEVCHLQDGAYFGEISLLLKGQLRTSTIRALETSLVYRLKKHDFDKSLVTNRDVKAKMIKDAEHRIKVVTRLDEEYQEKLFEESFKKIVTKTS